MNRKILLTGPPGCGKTTLIQRVVKELALPAGGFYTQEIRERSQRVGFKIVTLAGKEAVLAHVDFKSTQRVGKYGLDLSALATGIETIRAAMHARQLVVIDEIGPMELRSQAFRDVVNEAFNSPETSAILATITARSFPFSDAIKKRPDIALIKVGSDNRERLVFELSKQLVS
jgi:nucleoside-triphosphatase